MKKLFVVVTLLLFQSIIFNSCNSSDDSVSDIVQPDNPDPDPILIDPDAFYVDQDHVDANDTNDGHYKKDGGTGPWKTIQKMLNTLEGGEVGYVRASAGTYIPTVVTNAFDATAFFVTKSGTVEKPITISGYPGERPKIGFSTFEEGKSNPNYSGFAADFITSYVVIKNFEIANLSGSGIFTNPDHDPPNKGMVFEDLHIHDLIGIDNVGGIRLDGCDSCVIKNNIIHDIYDTHSNSNPITNRPYALHSGIHGYQPSNCIIENNLIYNVDKAIFQKQADETHEKSHIVRNNIIRNANKGLVMEIQGSGLPAPLNAEFYNNLIIDVETTVSIPLQDVGEQGDGILIYNNTLINCGSIGYIQEMLGIEIFNNIIFGNKPKWSSNTNMPLVFSTGATVGVTTFKNGISYFDNNLYFNIAENWVLERDGPNTIDINSFFDWQNTIAPEYGLAFNPDLNSKIADPLFSSLSTEDFSLKTNSPALIMGRGGNYEVIIGAIKNGSKIGPNWKLEAL
ncbi:hypothetical protein ACSTS3_04455 [Aquimarina muelleri]|uniref:hypothetical protein n=1 Tax=Aquimarina muelleri TaxID=279356 RepID=UPI003F683B95